jgi:hypothetical protein
VSRYRRLVADLIVSAFVPFLAIWLYEMTNWMVLALQGYGVSLSMAGWIPLGVSAVTSSGPSLLTKVAQLAVAIGLLLPLKKLFSSARLPLAEALIVSSVGIYLASTYWEMLSLLAVLPLAIHVGIFIAGTGTSVLVLLHHSQVGRPHPVRGTLLAASGHQPVPH